MDKTNNWREKEAKASTVSLYANDPTSEKLPELCFTIRIYPGGGGCHDCNENNPDYKWILTCQSV